MSLNLSESQAVTQIANILYNFLPGTPHPYADLSISFEGIANDLELNIFWAGGSKKPAITNLLEKTLEFKRDQFCNLIYNIVRRGLNYRNNRNDPIQREEIKELNELILKVKFKIPDLWDSSFLDSLPSAEKQEYEEKTKANTASLIDFKNEFTQLHDLAPQERGYKFESFLKRLFDFFDLDAKSSFRLTGEQIDGSFQLNSETYLLEAKWQNLQTSQQDLLVFQGKVEGKATWARGLFISYSGFTKVGLQAFSRGRSTKIIGMDGLDLHYILDGKIELPDALSTKTRIAAETGNFHTSVYNI